MMRSQEERMADQAAIEDLLAKMEHVRGHILAHLDALSEEEAARPPEPGEWSAKEQLSHMCEMESLYRAWVEKALKQDGANLNGTRGEPVAIPLTEAREHSLADHVAELKRQRGQTLQLIARIAPEQYDHNAGNSIFGTLTVLQWLRSYYRHDRMHFDQMRGREPTYKPRFRGGQEPDQRRRG
jgi:hypothetical protein